MGTTGIVIVVVVAIVAISLLISVGWFLRDSNKRIQKFAKSSDLVPGRPGRAPAEWSTSSAPEALLHQRVRYAIADVHGNGNPVAVPPPADSAVTGKPGDLDDLDDAVFALDDRIIAAAQLPAAERTKALAELEPAVASLEGLTGRLWEAPSHRRHELIDAVISRLRG
ncbi:Secreted protein OS=Tsukamurella paurometabola (strain ATCC 8368 / DSM / CCUG 35730 / CIP 100753/ JCM 10117 / KCTC 9821 / NBRC 16120 / NCIMB 702349 / NCTC 13040) OX=521096 GN=Tpau_0430 PE=4 SV=1 [Tsukamurella paurometabola]|uniref:Uncharacterized protein n=1 Tax=Tsukamurella paurometabola (strain ATCC 8368 / DSM 20162 / CCUG 35730 / CIP 100753 / JCM 10117 / KCTC 9821 / NBRC 16120 / NCIMB 702349 / NCTC 13040) TaxID=521096 RepID=D5URL8_TSUPD|nr:hypothetical protein [Tsukamurella paurometabola]ADG77071.1 hypothetical protein Tpau_0430 [Tsukamurella paurometabola DSM 20162]SUP42670.1 Uncharacterised protein [Tsukamurella paurometabola]